MAGLDYFEVECTEDGSDNYIKVATTVLQDHNLLGIVEGLHIYIDPQYPLFVAAGFIRPPRSVIKISDVGNVLLQDGQATIAVGDETYLAAMLKILWQKLGHDNVDQPDRFTVIIKNTQIPKDIRDWVVVDPAESLFKDLIYAIQVIAPEGFKVRRENYGKNRFSYAASENTLPAADVEKIIADRFARMEEALK
ncbi:MULTISPECIES: methanogenesis marker 17 protein [Methanocorpusculum]|jgi:putative methanogenesis marker protein 17|uniref:Methanogenesis marker 17 protein n=1 Tax=Methanocorpusculum parvum TaxID=2193 RepID=A0AAX0Q8N9_9EURY|nr:MULTISPECIES: methanogenesis marker 17 protein [Methanocorpusculum]MDD2248256.1 methanogenesis marker 17 protein [Methanocorpusculum sp.]MDD2802878.1 methanogenesis marker 17 protein [Methanocorpusculum sp.]MDD3046586.1 methanogenesis marker 17 protein [Methanocorpusculum sp.]MDD3912049.1 methanogenesis marker 17 protein [Methanocorpusculum sp.]MDD4423163.1 methanogenesis marker 17 protein [Methanocorpusculum parvum]